MNDLEIIHRHPGFLWGFQRTNSIIESDCHPLWIHIGLHINWKKSYIYRINEVADIQSLADILGETWALPTKYLGMPLSAKRKYKRYGMRCRKLWKKTNQLKKSIYLYGRKIDFEQQHAWCFTHIYDVYLSCPYLCDRKDRCLKEEFLLARQWWQEENPSWVTLTKNEKNGGMGVRNRLMHNRRLIMKWLWRFNIDDNQLWKQVTKANYGEEGLWTTKEVTTPYGCNIWRSIRNLWPIFQQRIGFKIGNGMKISCWNNVWIGENTPIISFQNYTAFVSKHQ